MSNHNHVWPFGHDQHLIDAPSDSADQSHWGLTEIVDEVRPVVDWAAKSIAMHTIASTFMEVIS